MKNMPLSELRKKSLQYFRKIGIVRGDGRRKKSIEYIVQKSYEALPKGLKKYVEDPEQAKSAVYNSIMASGSSGEIEPYNALKQYAADRKKKSGDNTKEYIYKRFREELPAVYSKYNSYVYRLGFSAAQYFKEKAELSQDGSIVNVKVKLPKKESGVVYDYLYINFDFSGDYIDAKMEQINIKKVDKSK